VGRVQVAVSLVEKNYILSQLLWSRLLSILFALICASGLGYILSRQLLRPMVQITEQVRLMIDTEKLTALDTSQIPPDEVNRLAETFNQLLERISATMVQQQRFISDASHELRSPLTSIRGHAELLLKRGRDNPAILDEGLQIIVRESERLTRLTEDLLLLAHSRKQQLTLERINLVPLIQQVVASMRALHPHLRMRGKDAELWIEGNSDAFKRILINLIDNALRATHQGKVTIGWRKLENGICEVYVEDTGAGIPSPSLPHLFERFYRVESARERNKGGAGLGLAIVKELVDWHRGTIRVSSEVAKGSCFTITLPLSPHEIS
jgi:signal transduction histidine kinase